MNNTINSKIFPERQFGFLDVTFVQSVHMTSSTFHVQVYYESFSLSLPAVELGFPLSCNVTQRRKTKETLSRSLPKLKNSLGYFLLTNSIKGVAATV